MNTTTQIDNYQDVIDSRDIIERIEELTDELCNWISDDSERYTVDWTKAYPEESAELDILKSLASEASDYAPDWEYGETLIRDSYFTDYIMEMLEDCGTLPADIPWYVEIDKEATAKNCQVDYTSVDYDGITYWVR